jgi:hypothetical protein
MYLAKSNRQVKKENRVRTYKDRYMLEDRTLLHPNRTCTIQASTLNKTL